MTPKTMDFLEAADECLADARSVLTVGVFRQVARLAYHAQFHAAQALIFERSGQVGKTHKGVNVQFHKLAKSEASFDPNLAGKLSATYHYKEIADYEIGVRAVVSADDATTAITIAEHFVAEVKRVLANPPPATPPT